MPERFIEGDGAVGLLGSGGRQKRVAEVVEIRGGALEDDVDPCYKIHLRAGGIAVRSGEDSGVMDRLRIIIIYD